MQDREEPPQPIFTVKDCGMAEFNGKYYVDTDHKDGFVNGKHCYRKNGVGDADSESTIEWYAYLGGTWYMTKNFKLSYRYYSVESDADQPPTSGWIIAEYGSGSPPQLVYEESDVPNLYVILYG